MNSNNGLFLPAPRTAPPLDPDFRPAVLAHRAFRQSATRSGSAQPVLLALEQADGSVSRFQTEIHPPGAPGCDGNYVFIERLVKFLLWARGGCRIYFAGPPDLGKQLQAHYTTNATGKFDAWIMGGKIYERPFEVRIVSPSELPPQQETSAPLGRHLEGCRIGFDLGASDRKVAALIDGQTVFSEETPWDPRSQSDPQWHFDEIMDSLKRAAAHLPRVDAIGGSSAGAYVNNRVKVASLFRGVPDDLFDQRIKTLFLEIQRAWNNVPFEIVNDGEVTALAGSMSLGVNAVLGVALGSSQAAGYVNPEGNITSWLNELAFVPVDYHPGAAVDEWSGDYGCGVQYFSQQAVGRLAPASGLDLNFDLPLPELLVEVQNRMAAGDDRAARIYESIGVYLGYTTAHYAEFYDFEHLLVLGRVTSGEGGRIIVERAREILMAEFPELKIAIHTPDEKQKRHGQAMAAASLPALPGMPG
jgi:predicted NBD/HSP70 family sugar kinase